MAMTSLLQDQVDHPEQPLSPNRHADKEIGTGKRNSRGSESDKTVGGSRVYYGATLLSPNSAIARAISESEGTVARMNEQTNIKIKRELNNERLQKARNQEVCVRMP